MTKVKDEIEEIKVDKDILDFLKAIYFVVNNGIAPQYYVENSHPPIISKEMFNSVQIELKRRSSLNFKNQNSRSVYNSKYVLSGILKCEKCEDYFRRIEYNARGKHYVRWRCKTRITKGVCQCNAHSISETELQNHIIRAINKLLGNKENALHYLKTEIKNVVGLENDNIVDVEKRIKNLQSELESCIHQNKDYEYITQELDRLILLKCEIQEYNEKLDITNDRMSEINDFIESNSALIEEFDEEIVRRIISKVVIGDKNIIVVFKSGSSIKLKKYIC